MDDTYHAWSASRTVGGIVGLLVALTDLGASGSGCWLILVFWVVRLSGAVACGFLLQRGLQLRGILRESQADMLAGRRSHTSDDVADAMRQCSLATRLQHTSGGWLGPPTALWVSLRVGAALVLFDAADSSSLAIS